MRLDLRAMFFFRHPKPVVDRRPVAEHSVQVEARDLPMLVELKEIPKPELSVRAVCGSPGDPELQAEIESGGRLGAAKDASPFQHRHAVKKRP
ncbi:hypothetical protein ACQ859_26020 [Roseateles chitinivorans]|uniref:hypothetical protein n=1 Tax=Roseateles chitinivorans TaxID=2917965 RepID=UPI003D66F8A6